MTQSIRNLNLILATSGLSYECQAVFQKKVLNAHGLK